MLMRIYLPQTRRVLILFVILLIPVLFFIFFAYENLQGEHNGKNFLLVCLASIVVLVVVFLFSFFSGELKLSKKIWSAEEESSDETSVDFNQRLEETARKIISLNKDMAVIFSQIHYGRLNFDNADVLAWSLIKKYEEVIRKFLFSAVNLHKSSTIVCLGQAGELLGSFLIYNRKGQNHNVLIAPFIVTETFKKVLKNVAEKKITLIIALYCESDYQLEGVNVISLPTFYQVVKGMWVEVCETAGKEEYVF